MFIRQYQIKFPTPMCYIIFHIDVRQWGALFLLPSKAAFNLTYSMTRGPSSETTIYHLWLITANGEAICSGFQVGDQRHDSLLIHISNRFHCWVIEILEGVNELKRYMRKQYTLLTRIERSEKRGKGDFARVERKTRDPLDGARELRAE